MRLRVFAQLKQTEFLDKLSAIAEDYGLYLSEVSFDAPTRAFNEDLGVILYPFEFAQDESLSEQSESISPQEVSADLQNDVLKETSSEEVPSETEELPLVSTDLDKSEGDTQDVAAHADGDDRKPVYLLTELTASAAESLMGKIFGQKFFLPLAVFGMTKQQVDAKLEHFKKRDSSILVSVHERASDVLVRIRYTDRSSKVKVDQVAEDIKLVLGDAVYAETDETLAEYLIHTLAADNKKLAVAESFTGGNICARLTLVPGSSAVLNEGIVAYTDDAKHDRLFVQNQTLVFNTAVSVQAAYQMTAGLLKNPQTDFAVATTGYAGPTGVDVGRCYIAAGDRKQIEIFECRFSGTRQEITMQGVTTALVKLAELLAKRKGKK